MIFQCILWFSLYKVLKLVKLVQVALHTRVCLLLIHSSGPRRQGSGTQGWQDRQEFPV